MSELKLNKENIKNANFSVVEKKKNVKKVLICVDMQNSFITGELANKEAEKILPRVANLIKNFDGDVIFTRDTHDENYLETNEGKHLPIAHCIKGTYGHQIHRSLLGWRDAVVIDKETFGSMKLVNEIRSMYNVNGYNLNNKEHTDLEFYICGTCTDICVVSNVFLLKAAFPEAKIVVHKKACAGTDFKSHNAALDIMKKCQIEVED